MTVGGLEGSDPVTCSRQVVIVPDKALSDVSTVTLIVCLLIMVYNENDFSGIFRWSIPARRSRWSKKYERIKTTGRTIEKARK